MTDVVIQDDGNYTAVFGDLADGDYFRREGVHWKKIEASTTGGSPSNCVEVAGSTVGFFPANEEVEPARKVKFSFRI